MISSCLNGPSFSLLSSILFCESRIYSIDLDGGPVDVIESAANNYPHRGGKYSEFEGGIRSAAFVSGGLLPASVRGTQQSGIIHVTDW